jgi:hypothetical protein
MRRALLVLVATLTVFVPSALAARGLPKVLTQETPVFQVRPATISYTGDGTGIVGGLDGTSVRHLGHLNWTTYNSGEGLAVGLVWLDNCTPDCAQGRFSAHRVHVRVSQASNGHFRLLTLRYRDQGHSYVDHRVAHYYHGGGEAFWAYAICDAQYTPRCP